MTAALLLSGGPIAASDVTASPPTPRSGLTARVTPAFFNPSLGQSAEIALDGAPASDLVLEILDRDGFVVRRLDAEHDELAIGWDGRDDSGDVVPDEAYSLRIVREGDRGARSILYDSNASSSPEPLSIAELVYARQKATMADKVGSWLPGYSGTAHVGRVRGRKGPCVRGIRRPASWRLAARQASRPHFQLASQYATAEYRSKWVQ